MTDLHTIDRASLRSRAITGVAAITAQVVAWFAISWQLGDLLAELTQPSDPGSVETAEAAIGLAPSDPATYALQSSVDPVLATIAAGQAVQSAPNDFRYRVQFGRALEQSGDLVAA